MTAILHFRVGLLIVGNRLDGPVQGNDLSPASLAMDRIHEFYRMSWLRLRPNSRSRHGANFRISIMVNIDSS